MTTNNPLDIAAQIAQIAWTVQENPGDRRLIEPVLQRALKLAGLRDINPLKLRKVQGKSIYGQITGYPQASDRDIRQLQTEIERVLGSLTNIRVPQDKPITPAVEAIDAPATALLFEDFRYAPPLP